MPPIAIRAERSSWPWAVPGPGGLGRGRARRAAPGRRPGPVVVRSVAGRCRVLRRDRGVVRRVARARKTRAHRRDSCGSSARRGACRCSSPRRCSARTRTATSPRGRSCTSGSIRTATRRRCSRSVGQAHVLGAVDPFWRHTTAPYGPLFLWIVSGIVAIAGSHLILGVLLIRVLDAGRARAARGVRPTARARARRGSGARDVVGAAQPARPARVGGRRRTTIF